MMKKFGIAALILAIMLTAGACQRNNNGAPDDTPPAATPGGGSPPATPGGTAGASPGGATNVNAEAIYQAQCLACHGADLSGGMGPGLNDIGGRMSDEDIAGVIANGRNQMPAFKGRLTDEEIHGLSSWLAGMKG